MTGWWLTYPSEKYEFVNWDDDIPDIWKIKFMFQTTNQMKLLLASANLFFNPPFELFKITPNADYSWCFQLTKQQCITQLGSSSGLQED